MYVGYTIWIRTLCLFLGKVSNLLISLLLTVSPSSPIFEHQIISVKLKQFQFKTESTRKAQNDFQSRQIMW